MSLTDPTQSIFSPSDPFFNHLCQQHYFCAFCWLLTKSPLARKISVEKKGVNGLMCKKKMWLSFKTLGELKVFVIFVNSQLFDLWKPHFWVWKTAILKSQLFCKKCPMNKWCCALPIYTKYIVPHRAMICAWQIQNENMSATDATQRFSSSPLRSHLPSSCLSAALLLCLFLVVKRKSSS